MSRVNFAVEQGYDIYAVNGNLLVSQLAGSAAPGGDAGPQDAAPLGTTYQRTDGSLYIKIANANAPADWQLYSFVLSGGYAPVNGVLAAGDTLEEAISYLDGNQLDLISLTGVAKGDVDLGTFTGAIIDDNQTIKAALQDLEDSLGALVTLSGVALDATDLGTFSGTIIPDNQTIKQALQALETFVEAIEGGAAVTASGVTTLQDIDTVLVDDVHSSEWEIVAWEEATPANKIFQKITALHNGTASADATVVDDTPHTKLKVGSNFNLVITVDLNGTGASQAMRLRASSSTAGVAMEVRRTDVLKTI